MPWWVWILFIFSGVLSAIGSLPKFYEQENREFEKAINSGKKVFCRYCVLDVETNEELVIGEKLKALPNTNVARIFKDNLRTIYEFSHYQTVNDKTCLVTYWAGAPKLRPRPRRTEFVRLVTTYGKEQGMR